MSNSSLSANKSVRVSYEQLKSAYTPESTSTWRPVSHVDLVDTLRSELSNRGLVITREEFAVNPSGSKLFGTMDVEGKDLIADVVASAFGFRHSNDKRMSIWTVGGGRVFVCDNMLLSGDVTILKQKHNWSYNLRSLIQRGLDTWQSKRISMADSIERMQNTPINDETARSLLAKALYEGVTTFETFKSAYDLYFVQSVATPEYFPDCAPRSAWGLHNAYTRALKGSNPNTAFDTNIALGRLFNV